ncbi:MAG: hypothetical protein AMJ56_14070 [Anaerolineae bacterium SG8_19]|nr:MAG: hypothetical protein AMJ56_14070 [Anaerolineae bacterium SG8_19]HCB50594.1 hypothetical protein [Chloroflexota bacterium]
MISQEQAIGFSVELDEEFESVKEKVIEALKVEGFGVLTEIDVKATLKKKLDVDFHPYQILGACNPPLAYEALKIAPHVGLLLPCNVIVNQITDDRVNVSFIDPVLMMEVASEPALKGVAEDAKARLLRVMASLEGEVD